MATIDKVSAREADVQLLERLSAVEIALVVNLTQVSLTAAKSDLDVAITKIAARIKAREDHD